VSRLWAALEPKEAVRRRRQDIAKARRRTSLKAFLKICDQVEGQYRIRPGPSGDLPVSHRAVPRRAG